MAPAVETLESAALILPPSDRAHLVERLIRSLDRDPRVEDAWAAEVDRRNTEIDAGTVTPLAGPDSVAKLRSELR